MKKIFWTSIFWIVVFSGFVLYMKLFDSDMAANVSTWLGATTITTSWELLPTTGIQMDIMSGVTDIQTTLIDIQTTLGALVGTTPIPVVTPIVVPSTGNDLLTGN